MQFKKEELKHDFGIRKMCLRCYMCGYHYVGHSTGQKCDMCVCDHVVSMCIHKSKNIHTHAYTCPYITYICICINIYLYVHIYLYIHMYMGMSQKSYYPKVFVLLVLRKSKRDASYFYTRIIFPRQNIQKQIDYCLKRASIRRCGTQPSRSMPDGAHKLCYCRATASSVIVLIAICMKLVSLKGLTVDGCP